jgi:hypothetical protein
MLTHQHFLALHHTTAVLWHRSLIHHPLEVLKILGLQSIGQSIIQAIQKVVLLLLISVNFTWCIARMLGELRNRLVHRLGPCFGS